MEKKGREPVVDSGKKSNTESIYSVSEFAANCEAVFGPKIRRECVVAAFKAEKKTGATKKEAISIVNKFMRKEIK